MDIRSLKRLIVRVDVSRRCVRSVLIKLHRSAPDLCHNFTLRTSHVKSLETDIFDDILRVKARTIGGKYERLESGWLRVRRPNCVNPAAEITAVFGSFNQRIWRISPE